LSLAGTELNIPQQKLPLKACFEVGVVQAVSFFGLYLGLFLQF
jgi:hypothetical protein